MSEDGAKKASPTAPVPVRAPSRKPAQFLRSTADRVPTKWFVTAALGAFLLATSLFGGLNTAPEVLPPAVALGEKIEAGGYDIVLSEVSVHDEAPAEFVGSIEGSDKEPAFFVSVTATVTNQSDLPMRAKTGLFDVWDRSLGLFGSKEQETAVALDGVRTRPGVFTANDQYGYYAIFQPLIPTTISLWWAVPSDYDSDQLALRIYEYAPASGAFLAYSYETLWNQGAAVGMISLPLSEVRS